MISAGGLSRRAPELAHEPADDETHEHAAAHADDEQAAGVDERERAGHDRRDGDAVQDEPAAVVHEALALDDRHELAWDAEPPGDRRRRERVGRRDDRAEDECAGPREVVDDGVRDDRDADGRDDHEPDRE